MVTPALNVGVNVLADGLNVKDFAFALSLVDFLGSFFSAFADALSFVSGLLLFSVPDGFDESLFFDVSMSFAEGSSFAKLLLVSFFSLSSLKVDADFLLDGIFFVALTSSFPFFSGVTTAVGDITVFSS